MSDHTFKVGDRVRHLKGDTYVVRAIVEHGKTGQPVVAVSDPENRAFYWIAAECLSPLPLFEPVERWMYLSDTSGIGQGAYDRARPEWNEGMSSGRWVKVVISPAEDQS